MLSARHNAAPSHDVWVIRRNPTTGAYQRDRLNWGFKSPFMVQRGIKESIRARCEGVATNGLSKSSCAQRRCLVPVDNFFEWRDSKGQKGWQPYAVAMKDWRAFAIAGIWTGVSGGRRQLAAHHRGPDLSCDELISQIHDRMPVIVAPGDYERWLNPIEPDPNDLLRPYPAALMTMWAISAKVNSPDNDTPDILEEIEPPMLV